MMAFLHYKLDFTLQMYFSLYINLVYYYYFFRVWVYHFNGYSLNYIIIIIIYNIFINYLFIIFYLLFLYLYFHHYYLHFAQYFSLNNYYVVLIFFKYDFILNFPNFTY